MSGLSVWLDDEERWADVPGVDRVELIESAAVLPRELAIEWGYVEVDVQPEPTPIERALAILQPHLDDEPLYQPPTA